MNPKGKSTQLLHQFLYKAEVESTQDLALETLLKWKSVETQQKFQLVMADNQTRGRGTRSREWQNSTNSNDQLTFSIATEINPQWRNHPIHGLTLVMGEALWLALKKMGLKSESLFLKWPNDLMLQSLDPEQAWKKVGGILCEQKKNCLVIGIGLNLLSSPSNLPHSDCLRNLLPANSKVDIEYRKTMALQIFQEFEKSFAQWLKDPVLYIKDLAQRLEETLMKPLIKAQVELKGQQIAATIIGIDPNGFLLIQAQGSAATITIHSSDELRFYQFSPR